MQLNSQIKRFAILALQMATAFASAGSRQDEIFTPSQVLEFQNAIASARMQPLVQQLGGARGVKQFYLEPFETHIVKFYQAINELRAGSELGYKAKMAEARWMPLPKGSNSPASDVFIIPYKIIKIEDALAQNAGNVENIQMGMVSVVLEAGVGPTKIGKIAKPFTPKGEREHVGVKKDIFYQEGGPSKVEWWIFLNSNRVVIHPADSVLELAALSRLNEKDLYDYSEARKEVSYSAGLASRTMFNASIINNQVAFINQSYTYSGYASAAMLGLSLLSLVVSDAASTSSLSKLPQIETLPNF